MPSDKLNIPSILPSPLQQISLSKILNSDFILEVKRDDLIHPQLSGNKYRKLLGHIEHINMDKVSGIVTMGGPWSNHTHATAWLCQERNIPCVVLVRGPEPKVYSDTLTDIISWGAEVHFISRQEYRELRVSYESNSEIIVSCIPDIKDYYFIPEGGRHHYSECGMQQLAAELEHDYDAVFLAVGTGTTLGSLVANWSNPKTIFYGVLAIDAQPSQWQTIDALAPSRNNTVILLDDYLFGGYAHSSGTLNEFIVEINHHYHLLLEPVYTGKVFYALTQLIQSQKLTANARVLFIHTGGLQGLRGFPELANLQAIA